MSHEQFITRVKQLTRLEHAVVIIESSMDRVEECARAIKTLTDSRGHPATYAKKVADVFLSGKYEDPLGDAGDLGQWFTIKGGIIVPATEEDIRDATVFAQPGYDAGGQPYYGRFLGSMNPFTRDEKTITFHWRSSPKQRTENICKLFDDHDATMIDEAKEVGKVMLTGEPKTYKGHSYSTLFFRMVKNVVAEDLFAKDLHKDTVIKEMKKIRGLLLGGFPIWGQITKSKDGKNKIFEEAQQGDELYIMSASDLFLPPMLDYAKKAIEMTAELSNTHPFMALHHPLYPNKNLIIIAPGMTPEIIKVSGKNRVNVCGHGIDQYMATFGLLEGTQCRPGLEPVREAIEDFLAGRGEGIAEKLGAKPMKKAELATTATTAEILEAVQIAQLMQEDYHWRAGQLKGDHPLLRL